MEAGTQFLPEIKPSIQSDVFSGITVALALVPEAVAFAFVAGVPPIVGLYGAFIMCLITAVFGGRPGMISGATGAMAVVMVHLVQQGNAMGAEGSMAGLQYLFVTLLLVGIIQILAGAFKLGKFIRLVPSSVMMGFVNGLAIVIFLSQINMFKVKGQWLQGSSMGMMLLLVGATLGLMFLIPKIHKKAPAGLLAILATTAAVILMKIDTSTVLSFIQQNGGTGIKGQLPSFAIPIVPLSFETLKFIFPYALILAAIGLIESLMTLNLIDELTKTRGHGNKECIAQGAANFLNGIFGGMGGCAMIGQSIINVTSGGRGRLSGIVASISLLIFFMFAAPYIEAVPIAALVGVMFFVVLKTFAWNTFKIINKAPKWDIAIIILVTALTVFFDLAIAVFAGVIVSALIFAWENALRIRARVYEDERGIAHYEIFGPLFFASTTLFLSKFKPEEDPREVIIDFKESRVMDLSAIEAINKVAASYQRLDKNVHLRHLSKDCRRLIKKAEKICDVNVLEDPDYFVSVDNYRLYTNDQRGLI